MIMFLSQPVMFGGTRSRRLHGAAADRFDYPLAASARFGRLAARSRGRAAHGYGHIKFGPACHA